MSFIAFSELLMIVSSMKLTDKQKRFIEEYTIDFNATQAALRAGYSKKTAYSIGQENLTKPEIQEGLGKIKKELSEKVTITKKSQLKDLEEVKQRNRGLDDKTVVKAIEVQNKMLGFNTHENAIVNITGIINSLSNHLPEDDIRRSLPETQ